MAKDWHEVKDQLEAELDRIWWDEPEEVTMSKLGIFPSGAGVYNQVLGNLFFQLTETQAMGWATAEPIVKQLIANPTFTLEQCEIVWKYLTVNMTKLLGGMDPPRCPAPWLNLPKLLQFSNDIVNSFETVKTKEELSDLLWSWFNYVNCVNLWFALAFPWHLGKMLPQVTPKDVEQLARLSGMKVQKEALQVVEQS